MALDQKTTPEPAELPPADLPPMVDFPDQNASGVTPMLAQFLDVKSAHNDCLLFYRMGDFYEMFFRDAVDAAAALDITLTKRGKVEGRDVPMCGVPVHAAETYLSRLIRKGFRVAICEQSESPEEAKKKGNKGPLRRDVVRIVTPALIEDEFFPRVKIISDFQHPKIWRCQADLSTGDVFVETIDRPYRHTARLSGAELIASDQPDADHGFADADPKAWWTSACSRMFASKDGEAHLRVYNTATMDGIADLSRADYAAAGALVQYLDQTQKGRALRLKPIIKVTSGTVMEIDPASRRSLEITRTLSGQTKGSLLSVIDTTLTAAGGRQLASRISAPLTDIAAINARLDLVEAVLSDPVLGGHLAEALQAMPDLERALSRLSLGHGGPRDLAAIGRGIMASTAMAEAIDQRRSDLIAGDQLAAMSSHLKAPSDLSHQITTTLSDDLPLLARDGGFVRKGFHSGLDDLKSMRDESRRLIAQLQMKYTEETGIPSLKIKHNNVLGYHIDVRNTHGDKMMGMDGFIHRQTTAQTVRFTTTELADLEREMSSAGDRALALEMEIFEALSDVRNHPPS